MRRALTCLVTLALLTATPAIASADTWPQYRNDSAASGVNSDQPAIQATRWRVRWSKNEKSPCVHGPAADRRGRRLRRRLQAVD